MDILSKSEKIDLVRSAGYEFKEVNFNKEMLLFREDNMPKVDYCPYTDTWKHWPNGSIPKIEAGDIYEFLEWYGGQGDGGG